MARATSMGRRVDPEGLAAASKIGLRARIAVEGFIQGLHKSNQKGFNVEFADFREYSKGDDTRHIDWRVYARTDKFFIRQYEEETSMRVYLIVDQSRSMEYGEGDRNKLNYACRAAAALAYLMVKQGDAVSLITFNQGVEQYLPPRNSPQQLQRVWQTLEGLEGSKATNIPETLHSLANTIKRRGLIILLSDLFDYPGKILKGLAHFRRKRFEVIAFHVLTRDEIEFPFSGDYKFRDMERDTQVETSSHAIRSAYLEEFRKYQTQMEKGCRQNSIDYELLDTSKDLNDALLAYLVRRQRIRSYRE